MKDTSKSLSSTVTYEQLQKELNKIKSKLPKSEWNKINLEIKDEWDGDWKYQVITINYKK